MYVRGFGKMLWMMFGMAVCIFLGVALATQGTERVYGPLGQVADRTGAAQSTQAEGAAGGQRPTSPSRPPESAGARQAQSAQAETERSKPEGDIGINRVGNKAGELLQIFAYHSIQMFVRLIDALFR